MVNGILKTVVAVAVSCACLLGAARAGAQGESYGWSISASSSDAYANHIAFPGANVYTYYLWLLCAPTTGAPGGVASAEFGLAMSGGAIVSFTPMNGFVNAGTATNLQLSVASCPTGPVLAGQWTAFVAAPGNLCLTPSMGGKLGTEDCVSPPSRPDTWRGLEFGGTFCFQGLVCDVVDAAYPCCFPDGSCSSIPAIDFEEFCDGQGGYGPPVQFCPDWHCPAVGVGPGSVHPLPWGRIKAGYR